MKKLKCNRLSRWHRYRTAAALLALGFALVGCRPAGRAYSSLQYHNIEIRLARSTMTMRAGDGSVDARRYMEAEHYVGVYKLGGIAVRYPDGLYETAAQVAHAFADAANLVALRLGIEWAFELEIRIARLPDDVTGLVYSTPLKSDRKLVFPVFVNSRGEVRADWAPVVAHEMTEASMIAPRDRHKMVLADAYSGSFCIGTGTRWFREGVSDRAGDLLGSRLFPGRWHPAGTGRAKLAQAGTRILDWNNRAGAPDYYSASAALIREAEGAAGDYAIAEVMAELAKEHVPGGRGLRRAFERGTGLSLPRYLSAYSTPWLGAEFADTKPDGLNPPLVAADNQVVIRRVYPAAPASRWKLAEGDIVVSLNGRRVTSAGQLEDEIARRCVGESVCLRIRRGDSVREMRVKLIEMPADLRRLVELSNQRASSGSKSSVFRAWSFRAERQRSRDICFCPRP